jgi:hypothetical protein
VKGGEGLELAELLVQIVRTAALNVDRTPAGVLQNLRVAAFGKSGRVHQFDLSEPFGRGQPAADEEPVASLAGAVGGGRSSRQRGSAASAAALDDWSRSRTSRSRRRNSCRWRRPPQERTRRRSPRRQALGQPHRVVEGQQHARAGQDRRRRRGDEGQALERAGDRQIRCELDLADSRVLRHAQIGVTINVCTEVSDARALQALKWLGKQLGS